MVMDAQLYENISVIFYIVRWNENILEYVELNKK